MRNGAVLFRNAFHISTLGEYAEGQCRESKRVGVLKMSTKIVDDSNTLYKSLQRNDIRSVELCNAECSIFLQKIVRLSFRLLLPERIEGISVADEKFCAELTGTLATLSALSKIFFDCIRVVGAA